MSHSRHPSAPKRPTAGTMLDEILPLFGAIPLYGPPVVFFAGPWLLFGLMLAGPFALLMTIVIAMLAAGLLIVAIAASPYLLVRYLRSAWAYHATSCALRSHVRRTRRQRLTSHCCPSRSPPRVPRRPPFAAAAATDSPLTTT